MLIHQNKSALNLIAIICTGRSSQKDLDCTSSFTMEESDEYPYIHVHVLVLLPVSDIDTLYTCNMK